LWIALLHGRCAASLAASTGVHRPAEVVKYLLAGADAVMTTSALLEHGPQHLGTLVAGLDDWLDRRGYASVRQMKGSMSQRKVADPTAFERANYIKTLESFRPPR
jgi:dihydroorotate dehydrogenase (fumarate)